jgi:hypothetical protein
MPFVVIETSSLRGVAVVPLDADGPPVEVRELCRADTLADLMNAIEDSVYAECRAKRDAALARAVNGHEPWHGVQPKPDAEDVLSNLFGGCEPAMPDTVIVIEDDGQA